MKRPLFVVLVPVKSPTLGKSRLQVPAHLRPGLASAFALDTITAARDTVGVAEVVAVTSDEAFAERCREFGIRTLPDDVGLNEALAAAARAVRRRHPDAVPVAVCADLPCLLPEDLATALGQAAAGGAWFVADADGEGTTTYVAPYDAFTPRFGSGSRAAHLAAGAREVVGPLPTLRRDVDDETALSSALETGVGRHTAEAVALLP